MRNMIFLELDELKLVLNNVFISIFSRMFLSSRVSVLPCGVTYLSISLTVSVATQIGVRWNLNSCQHRTVIVTHYYDISTLFIKFGI